MRCQVVSYWRAKWLVVEDSSPWGDFERAEVPAKGRAYVVVSITVANTGNTPVSCAPEDFELVTARGNVYRGETFFYPALRDRRVHLLQGDVFPGEVHTGDVVFETVAGEEPLRVMYRPWRVRLVPAARR